MVDDADEPAESIDTPEESPPPTPPPKKSSGAKSPKA
jgi:hypothetical protein